MHKEQVHVIGVQPFKTFLQSSCKILTSSQLKLGYQKNLLTGIRIAREPEPDTLLAASPAVSFRCVPLVDPPIKSFVEHQTIVQNVKHSSQ